MGRPPPVIGPGHHVMLVAETVKDLPAQITTPILVKDRLAVATPTTFLQFAREAPGVNRSVPAKLASLDTNAVRVPITVAAASLVQWVWSVRSAVREQTVELSLPCAAFGSFYRQDAPAGSVAIGCQDSLKLGQTELKAWEELEALRASAYRVFRSLQQPSRFLVLPATYRIGRYAAAAGDKAYKPIAMLYGVQDPDPAKTTYTLTATLVPDIQAAELAQLSDRLAALSSSRDLPGIVFPTEPGVAASTGFSWVVPSNWPSPTAVAVPDGLMVALTVPIDLALLMITMVDDGGLQGAVSFTIGDGTVLTAALAIDGTAVGPADTGPVIATIAGAQATLTNRSAQVMQVPDAVVLANGHDVATVAVDATLAPGASIEVTLQPNTSAVIAAARQAAAVPLTEMDIYVQEVTTTVTFIGQVTFANHAVANLAVKARLKGSSLEQTATLAENGTAQLSFTAPITAYLRPRVMEYALIETKATGTTVTPWREWDLNNSIIVGVTADQL